MRLIREFLISLCLVALLAFFVRDLSIPGLPMFHDSNPHISRAIAYHTAISDGQYPPMWAKEVLGGIGSGVLMLNYQIPYLIGELWHRLGASFFDSYKLTLGITYILSGLFIYLALRVEYGRIAAWSGAIMYSLLPYRFVDIFVRGALGESVSFIFPPLLLLGYSKSNKVLICLGWAGLFLTHPVASATFSAFFLGYTLLLKKNFEWKMYFIALAIAAFNILPTLYYTKYTYYSPSLSDTLQMFPTFGQLIKSPWGYGVSLPGTNDGMSFEIGILGLIIFIVGVVTAMVKKDKLLGYLTFSVAMAIFLMLNYSAFIYELFLGRIVDFPWRFLICVVLGIAIISTEVVGQVKNVKLQKLFAVLITLIMVWQAYPIAHTRVYWRPENDEVFFARETGDSYGEYAPIWRKTRDSSPFGERAEIISGKGSVTTLTNKSNYQKYSVNVESNNAQLRINTAYFIGWKYPPYCYITTRTLLHIDDSGMFVCELGRGETIVELKYETPAVQKWGNLITLAGGVILLWIMFQSYYQPLTKQRQ